MAGIPAAPARLSRATPGVLALFLVLGAGPALAVECGETVTGFARLHRDLICTTDPALTVRGGSLDLNGFTVVCDHAVDQQPSIGVLLNGRGARLRDGAVTGCVVAVFVSGSGRHRIEGLTASASNQGVFIERTSNGNRLLHSNILRGRDDAAIQIDGDNNRIRFNNVAGSLDQGLEVNGSKNRIIDNHIAGVVEGVQLMGDGNRVIRNKIIGAAERGVEVRAGAHVIRDNLIADGALDGIALLDDGNGNRVSRNDIYGNGDQGLFVGTLDNRLERNRVLLNGTDLQDNTPACDANLWRDNTFETSVSDDCVD